MSGPKLFVNKHLICILPAQLGVENYDRDTTVCEIIWIQMGSDLNQHFAFKLHLLHIFSIFKLLMAITHEHSLICEHLVTKLLPYFSHIN